MLLIVNPDKVTCMLISAQIADAQRDEDHGDPLSLVDAARTFLPGLEEDAMIALLDNESYEAYEAKQIAANDAWLDELFIAECLDDAAEVDAQDAIIEADIAEAAAIDEVIALDIAADLPVTSIGPVTVSMRRAGLMVDSLVSRRYARERHSRSASWKDISRARKQYQCRAATATV